MSVWIVQKPLALCLAMLLAFPASRAFALPPAATSGGQQTQSGASTASSTAAALPADASQAGANQQPANQNRPVGTAVAPSEATSGVTASRPAGAVIAPAKQRRVHSIFIKIAVVVAAGAAIGAVVALSHSSPSRPN